MTQLRKIKWLMPLIRLAGCLLLSAPTFVLFSTIANAQAATETKVGDFTIHHTAFNSSFIEPEIASIYGFTRGKDKALLNVAVTQSTENGQTLGLATKVSGDARNLMQQSTKLDFIEINEQEAVYYIAPFEFNDQEVMHFYIDVVLPGQTRTTEIKFTKKLYHD